MIIPENKRSRVDETVWDDDDLDFSLQDNQTKKRVDGFMINRMERYKEEGFKDKVLFQNLKGDFGTWTPELFKQSGRDTRGDLRRFLRNHGVYVPLGDATIYVELGQLAKQESFHEWTEEEIKEQIDLREPFDSRYKFNHCY